MVLNILPISEWLYIHWSIPGQKKLSAVKELKQAEKRICAENIKGWLMESEKSHTTMHKIIEKLGGVKYAEDQESYFYKKEVI